MLSGHPHIKRMRIHETPVGHLWTRKLVVETDLAIPASGNYAENKPLQELADYLQLLAVHDLADFQDVEIKEYRPLATEDARGRA